MLVLYPKYGNNPNEILQTKFHASKKQNPPKADSAGGFGYRYVRRSTKESTTTSGSSATNRSLE